MDGLNTMENLLRVKSLRVILLIEGYMLTEKIGETSLDYVAEVANDLILIEQDYVELGGFKRYKFDIKIGRSGIRLVKQAMIRTNKRKPT